MIINRLYLFFQFVSYLFKARSRYRVHSPFVYRYYTDVILSKQGDPVSGKIEMIRSGLLKQKGLVETTDFGSGANQRAYQTRFRKISSVTKYSSISQKYGRLLYSIVKETRPEGVLEMGTAMGISTMYIGYAAPTSHIMTMEGCAIIAEKANENFRQADLDNIEIIQGNFEHTLNSALESFDQLDFVFIDGNHRKDPTLGYFNAMLPKFHSGSVLVIDDIHWSKGMAEAWKEICGHKKVSITIDLFRLGIVLFKEDIAKQNFILRF